MSRDNTLSEDAINNINQYIDKIQVLNNRFYYHVDRSDTGCFYFPTPDSSSTVKFRGQCDQNIPVVPNFQPALVSTNNFKIQLTGHLLPKKIRGRIL